MTYWFVANSLTHCATLLGDYTEKENTHTFTLYVIFLFDKQCDTTWKWPILPYTNYIDLILPGKKRRDYWSNLLNMVSFIVLRHFSIFCSVCYMFFLKKKWDKSNRKYAKLCKITNKILTFNIIVQSKLFQR